MNAYHNVYQIPRLAPFILNLTTPAGLVNPEESAGHANSSFCVSSNPPFSRPFCHRCEVGWVAEAVASFSTPQALRESRILW